MTQLKNIWLFLTNEIFNPVFITHTKIKSVPYDIKYFK